MHAVTSALGGWVVGGGIVGPEGFGVLRGRGEGVLVSLDWAGELRWRHLFSSGGDDVVRAVERAADGALWVGGSFAGPMSGRVALAGEGRRAAWLRIGPEGDVEAAWALRPMPGPGRHEAHLADLAVAPDGALVLGGWFYGRVDVDPGPGERIVEAADRTGFVAMVEPGGSLRWLHTTEPEEHATVVGVSVDARGVYATGNLHTPADELQPPSGVALATHRVAAGDSEDAFIEALGPDGELRWRHLLASSANDSGTAIASLDGRVVAVGYVGAEAMVEGVHLRSRGRADAYVIGLDPEGRLLWHHDFGGPASDVANAVAMHGDEVAIAGRFRGPVDFALGGLGPGGSWRARGAARGSGFVIRYDRDGHERALFTTHAADEDGSRRLDGLAYDEAGALAAVGGEGGDGYRLLVVWP